MSAAHDKDHAEILAIWDEIKVLNERRDRIAKRIQARQDREYTKVLTVHQVIEKLSEANPELPVTDQHGNPVGWLHLYRSHPRDLSISPEPNPTKNYTVAGLIAGLKDLIGVELESYKGYTHTVTGDTKMWVSEYADPGEGIVAVRWFRSKCHLVTKEID
jgi:hypothetical protein